MKECKITVISEYKHQDEQQRREAYIEKMARAISLSEKKTSYKN